MEGIGSRIELLSSQGNQYRYTFCGEQYLSQSSQWQHFGLGDMNTVDSLVVKWPSGIVDYYFNVSANQKLTLIEGETSINNIEIAQGSVVFCEGDSVILFGGNYSSYLWSTGDTTKFITSYQSDTISLVVFDGLMPLYSDTIITQSLPSPVSDYSSQNPTCNNGLDGYIELQLNNTNPEILQFLWEDGFSEQNRYALSEGIYSVEVSYNGACPQIIKIPLESPNSIIIDSLVYILNLNNEDCVNHYTVQAAFQGGNPPYYIYWEVYDETGINLVDSFSEDFLDCISSLESYWIECLITDSLGCADSLNIQTLPILSTSDLNSAFNLFPNPTNGLLKIESLENINYLQIYNLLGVLVKEIKMINKTKTAEMNLIDLEAGKYILSIHDENFKVTYIRFVIIK
jgi:hypothetical protein